MTKIDENCIYVLTKIIDSKEVIGNVEIICSGFSRKSVYLEMLTEAEQYYDPFIVIGENDDNIIFRDEIIDVTIRLAIHKSMVICW